MTRSGPSDWFVRSRLKLRHIQLVVAIDAHRSIHKAAAQTNMTQPAATKLLSELETILEVQLFERSTRGVIPTPHGEALVRHAQAILGTLGHAEAEMQAISAGALGKLKVGVLLFLAPVLLPRALLIFKERNPAVTVQVQEGVVRALLPMLRHGDLDVVVGRLTPDVDGSGLHFEQNTEGHSEMTVVVRRGHPLAGTTSPSLSSLSNEAWILPTPEAHYRIRIDAAFRQEGIDPPKRVIESMSILTNTALLQGSDMLGIMPVDVARHYERLGTLATLAVPLPIPSGPVGTITRADMPYSPILASFVDAIRIAGVSVARSNEMVGAAGFEPTTP